MLPSAGAGSSGRCRIDVVSEAPRGPVPSTGCGGEGLGWMGPHGSKQPSAKRPLPGFEPGSSHLKSGALTARIELLILVCFSSFCLSRLTPSDGPLRCRRTTSAWWALDGACSSSSTSSERRGVPVHSTGTPSGFSEGRGGGPCLHRARTDAPSRCCWTPA